MKKVSYQEIFDTIDETMRLIDKPQNIDFIVGISRGGLFPAMHISTKLIKPLIAAYIDRQDNVYFDREEWTIGKNVLIVDDIVRSGKTLKKIKDLIMSKGVNEVETFTIFHLKNNTISPNYSAESDVDIEFPWDENKN